MPYKDPERQREAVRKLQAKRWRENRPGDHERVALAARKHGRKVSEWVATEKLKRGCAHCQYRANADALELDHIVPRRLTGEAPISMNSFPSVRAAFKNPNVQVLCANCHAIKSVGERRMQAEDEGYVPRLITLNPG